MKYSYNCFGADLADIRDSLKAFKPFIYDYFTNNHIPSLDKSAKAQPFGAANISATIQQQAGHQAEVAGV